MYTRLRCPENSSTPKRRRLGTCRNLRPISVLHSKLLENDKDISKSLMGRCESPPIPCNQVEFLSESNKNHDEISPQSPVLFNFSMEVFENDRLSPILDSKRSQSSNQLRNPNSAIQENSSISDMFDSKFELQEMTQVCSEFKKNVSNTFQKVNKSICALEMESNNEFIDTKDSFLLDIKESCVLEKNQDNNVNTFYGLSPKVKGLFKSLRNIDKFYDWQDECLNLPAIKQRRNLIYALPTSGGKTLVAEILMLKEVLNRKKNVLFVLPFVAIVQEKIWSLSPFAVQLDFLLEEYAAGKGVLPPKKRRKKNSIYIATIEKALILIHNLIELNRLNEIGLIVVDELHLIGEAGRGSTLEMLLTTVIFANKGIQIVGMSATIGNLPEIAKFLKAEVFQRHFRPVELIEYVKLEKTIYKMQTVDGELEIVPDREVDFGYSQSSTQMDPDHVAGLVWEVAPAAVLVFCPTKRNCENVAALLCKLSPREEKSHRFEERSALQQALKIEGASADLIYFVKFGVAFHHSGLASEERVLLENAYRSGTLTVLCCTSTLAAGVNLPARRVVVRSARVGRGRLGAAQYRQMVGRAGRANQCDCGESIIICQPREWLDLREMLSAGIEPARSSLVGSLRELVLSALSLRLAGDGDEVRMMMECSLMKVQAEQLNIDINSECESAIDSLIKSNAIVSTQSSQQTSGGNSEDNCEKRSYAVSEFGNAVIKAGIPLQAGVRLQKELHLFSERLSAVSVLLFLLTNLTRLAVRVDNTRYYDLYSAMDEECVRTANSLGITEKCAIKLMTGKPVTTVSEELLSRFYLTLMMYDLWKEVPIQRVGDKYSVARGTVLNIWTGLSGSAMALARYCSAIGTDRDTKNVSESWHRVSAGSLFSSLSEMLQERAAPGLAALCALPSVGKARAHQLHRAGFKRVEDIAKATVDTLMSSITHLSRNNATHLISAARMSLIEKVENLRADAEEVMAELNL